MNKPSLRFKEFSGEWEEKKLGEVSELTSSKRIFLSEYVSQGIPFYRGKEITDLKKGKVITDILYISNEKYEEILEKYGVPQRNDILITAVGTLGNVYRIPNNDKFYFKDGNLIWLKNIKVSSKYLEYDLEYHKKQILDSSIGSTQKALTIVNLNKISLNIPNIQEQKKIADFLSSVDKKISIVEEKLNLFNQYKKGIMQKIFNQELRFKDENGNNYPEWEKLKMKNIYKFSQGLQVEVENQFLIKDIGMERFIRIVDVTQNIDEIRYIKDVDNKYKVTYDDIFIVRYGASAGTIGFNFSGVIANNLFKLISLTDKVYSKFNYYQLTLDTIQEKIIQTSTSTSMPALSFKGIENIELNLPCLEEQKKIADFLSAIDNKIENISGNLESLKLFKKSMLQKMFV